MATPKTLMDSLRQVTEIALGIPSMPGLALLPYRVFVVQKTYPSTKLSGTPVVTETEILPIPLIEEANCGFIFNTAGDAEYEELHMGPMSKEWFVKNGVIKSGGYLVKDLLGTNNLNISKSKVIYIKITGENFGPDLYEITAVHSKSSPVFIEMTLKKMCPDTSTF